MSFAPIVKNSLICFYMNMNLRMFGKITVGYYKWWNAFKSKKEISRRYDENNL